MGWDQKRRSSWGLVFSQSLASVSGEWDYWTSTGPVVGGLSCSAACFAACIGFPVCVLRACFLRLALNGQLRTGTDQRNPTV